jgi:hypothetical protein
LPVVGEFLSIPGLGEPGRPNDWRRVANVYWQVLGQFDPFWEVQIWVEGRGFEPETGDPA